MEQEQFVQLTIQCTAELAEILIAELAEIGFDSFEETEEGLMVSVTKEQYQEAEVSKLIKRYQGLGEIVWQVQLVEKRNWNEEWEKNYDPIHVGDQIYVRATFHPADDSYPYQIVVNPKMSFGTGHHATTYLMLKQQLQIDHHEKKVIDIGCGTAILAIMAALSGASKVDACDIDDWSVENAAENFELNHIKPGFLAKGTIADVAHDAYYDIVLANINRNVLLEEMKHYANLLQKEALLLLSGFYEEDIPVIKAACEQQGMKLLRSEIKDQWAVCVFIKN